MLNDVKRTELFCDYYEKWVKVYKEGAIRKVTLDKYYMTICRSVLSLTAWNRDRDVVRDLVCVGLIRPFGADKIHHAEQHHQILQHKIQLKCYRAVFSCQGRSALTALFWFLVFLATTYIICINNTYSLKRI